MEKVTIEALRDKQQKVVEEAENAYNSAPFELKGLCKDILTAQRTVLRRLGWEANKTTGKSKPKEGFFKKHSKMAGELEVDVNPTEIRNKAKKGMFEASDELEVEDSKAIRNKAKKGMFEAKEVVVDKTEKANPKRLSKEQVASIKKLALEGNNAKEISDDLMIVIAKVQSVLSKMNKKAGNNLLASSNKKSSSLENEIRNSK